MLTPLTGRLAADFISSQTGVIMSILTALLCPGLQVQYQQVMRFLKELDRRERGMLYRRWRPKVPISKQYAAALILTR